MIQSMMIAHTVPNKLEPSDEVQLQDLHKRLVSEQKNRGLGIIEGIIEDNSFMLFFVFPHGYEAYVGCFNPF